MSDLTQRRIDIASALCFVGGSIAFYFDDWYTRGVTLYLIGSLGHLVAALSKRRG